MPYTKTTWKDRLVQYEKRYTVTDNGDGTVTIEQSPGTITEAGTPISAANMNKIEQGIADATVLAEGALPKAGGTVTGRIIAQLGLDGASSWGTLSSSSNGNAMFAQNAYLHPTDGTYRYRQTHASLGARGIVFLWSVPAQAAVPHWFDMGRIATTADATFTPTLVPLATRDNSLIKRQFTSGTYDFNTRGDGPFIEEVKSNASITFQNGPPGVTSGTLLQGEGSHNKWQTQLYMMQGNDRKIFFRTSADVNGTKEWRDWVELITSAGGQTINGKLSLGNLAGEKLYAYENGNTKAGFGFNMTEATNELAIFHPSPTGSQGRITFGKRLDDGTFVKYATFFSDGKLLVSEGTYGTTTRLQVGDGKYGLGAENSKLYLVSEFGEIRVANASGTDIGRVWDTSQLRNNSGVLELNNGGVWTPVGGIKSVQRGSTTTYEDISDPENPVLVLQIDVPISAVNTNKAFVVITSTFAVDGGGGFPSNYQAHAQLLNSTTVRINATVDGVTIHWQVVESY